MARKLLLAFLLLFMLTGRISGQEAAVDSAAQPRKAPVDTAAQPKKEAPPCLHPEIGAEASSPGGDISLRLVGKLQNYAGGDPATRCADIFSPKSVHISPDGKKCYVNSLEGCATVVVDVATNQVVCTISHRITAAHDKLWAPAREDLFPFTHYDKSNRFAGRPVESAFSHDGRYLWVPYYRRSYDINAQDPSACAVIDTRADTIVRLFETGPLPKMIACSPDGKRMAISHWGDNTVGLLDISSPNPEDWGYCALATVDYKLKLDYPLDTPVDRDTGSGYALRGTVFTPDSKYLLVGCMGGGGGIAVIDATTGEYLGRVLGMKPNVRHLLIHGDCLYLSINKEGYVQRCRLADFLDTAKDMPKGGYARFDDWENAKVAAGARTIEISPDGNYVFAACNTSSQICVVDTREMRQVCSIDVDSYPVGLDISADGKKLFSTSQARSGHGGNAVDIYEVAYAVDPAPQPAQAADSIATGQPAAEAPTPATARPFPLAWAIGAGALLLAIAAIAIFRRKR